MKTFRLKPEASDKIKALKNATGQTEAEIIEKLVAGWDLNITH
jgi:predicted DNA-binding protein